MTHDEIVASYETYLAENEGFETKNVKAAAARARKALGELGKLAKVYILFFHPQQKFRREKLIYKTH